MGERERERKGKEGLVVSYRAGRGRARAANERKTEIPPYHIDSTDSSI